LQHNRKYYVSININEKRYLLAFDNEGYIDLGIEVKYLAKVNDKLYAANEKNIYDVFDNMSVVYTTKEKRINQFFSFRNTIYFQEFPEEYERQYSVSRQIMYTKDFKSINSFEAKVPFTAFEINFAYFIDIK